MATEEQSAPPCCASCRWCGRTRTGLLRWCHLRRRKTKATSGTTCTLWDPIEGERYPAELATWAGCSSVALCEEHCDPTDLGRIVVHLRRRMVQLGIPTGADLLPIDDEKGE